MGNSRLSPYSGIWAEKQISAPLLLLLILLKFAEWSLMRCNFVHMATILLCSHTYAFTSFEYQHCKNLTATHRLCFEAARMSTGDKHLIRTCVCRCGSPWGCCRCQATLTRQAGPSLARLKVCPNGHSQSHPAPSPPSTFQMQPQHIQQATTAHATLGLNFRRRTSKRVLNTQWFRPPIQKWDRVSVILNTVRQICVQIVSLGAAIRSSLIMNGCRY